jgi:hypothetical protein
VTKCVGYPVLVQLDSFLQTLRKCPLLTNIITIHVYRNRGSSVNIVSDYGLEDRAIGDRSPAGAKDFFSSVCVQAGFGAHPASCPKGTGGPFPGVKRGRGVTLTTPPPHIVPSASMACSGTALLLIHVYTHKRCSIRKTVEEKLDTVTNRNNKIH